MVTNNCFNSTVKVYALKYAELLKENETMVNEYINFCLNKQISLRFNFNNKQLYLSGHLKPIKQAEKQFQDIENELLISYVRARKIEGILWWYEAWDATWQQYSYKISCDIEHHYKINPSSIMILNELGERVKIDFERFEEIYGTRIKRICRSKIDELQPPYWKLTPLNIERVVLDQDSDEYISIKADFDKQMAGKYTTFITIERIQNIRLFKQFCILHEEYVNKYGQCKNGSMIYLFHGCPETAAKKITERGFNRSYCGINGCLFGRGVYFSSDASYSNKYTRTNGKNEKNMFYSRVLLGRSLTGNSSMCEPPDGYESTTDGTHIFVCYYDSQCYPEYLLTYV